MSSFDFLGDEQFFAANPQQEDKEENEEVRRESQTQQGPVGPSVTNPSPTTQPSPHSSIIDRIPSPSRNIASGPLESVDEKSNSPSTAADGLPGDGATTTTTTMTSSNSHSTGASTQYCPSPSSGAAAYSQMSEYEFVELPAAQRQQLAKTTAGLQQQQQQPPQQPPQQQQQQQQQSAPFQPASLQYSGASNQVDQHSYQSTVSSATFSTNPYQSSSYDPSVSAPLHQSEFGSNGAMYPAMAPSQPPQGEPNTAANAPPIGGTAPMSTSTYGSSGNSNSNSNLSAHGYGTVASLPANNPYATQPPSVASISQQPPLQHQQSPSQSPPQSQAQPPSQLQPVGENIPVGVPFHPPPPMSQILCPFCRSCLRYPAGSELIRCGQCQNLLRIPPPSNGMTWQQYPPTGPVQGNFQLINRPPPMPTQQQTQQQQQQQQPSSSSQSSHVQFQCRTCAIWLAADLSVGGGVTRCPQCQTLMRPTLNMTPQQQQQAQQATSVQQRQQQQHSAPTTVGAPSQVRPQSAADRETALQVLRDYAVATGQVFNESDTHQMAWLQQQYDKVVQQQKELIEKAKQSKQQQQQPVAQPNAQPAQPVQPQYQPHYATAPLPAYAPQPSYNHSHQAAALSQSSYPNVHQQMISAESSYLGRHAVARPTHGDYSSASYTDYSKESKPAPAHTSAPSSHALPSVSSTSSVPSAYSAPIGSSYATGENFESDMERRLRALEMDEERTRTHPPTKATLKGKGNEDKRAPLLENQF